MFDEIFNTCCLHGIHKLYEKTGSTSRCDSAIYGRTEVTSMYHFWQWFPFVLASPYPGNTRGTVVGDHYTVLLKVSGFRSNVLYITSKPCPEWLSNSRVPVLLVHYMFIQFTLPWRWKCMPHSSPYQSTHSRPCIHIISSTAEHHFDTCICNVELRIVFFNLVACSMGLIYWHHAERNRMVSERARETQRECEWVWESEREKGMGGGERTCCWFV
jgi:hypothetical protein